MPHKLATNWTCHLPPIDASGGLSKQGTMDLRDMGDDGKITTGRYYLPSGGFNTLEGEAVGGTPVFYLTLREFTLVNGHKRLLATYDGILAYDIDNSNRLAVIGKKHSESPGPGITGVAFSDQNDTVWVITKP